MRKFFIAAAVAVISVVASGSSAQAAFQVTLQVAGFDGGNGVGNPVVVDSQADFSTLNYTGTFGGFNVKVFGGSSDNGASLSDLLTSNTSVSNTNGTAKTLTIAVSQTGYTLPVGSPLRVVSGVGGSINAGTLTLTNMFQAYADKNNNLFGTTDFTNGPQTGVQSGSTYQTGSAVGLFSRTGNYSLTSVITFKLSAGGNANFASQENVTPTPAPAGLVLALTGVPFLGLGAWIRRKVKAQNS